MSREEYSPIQSIPEIPITDAAENIVRDSVAFSEHSRLRRLNTVRKIGNTITTIFKEGLIISSPALAELEPDLGDMEAYRQFLRGDNDETIAS